MRLARVVIGASRSSEDFRNLADLCRACGVGVARGTLRGWCARERIRPRAFLDFCRVFRAISVSHDADFHPIECLELADKRSVDTLLARGVVNDLLANDHVGVDAFCARQRYVTNVIVLDEVLRLWARRSR